MLPLRFSSLVWFATRCKCGARLYEADCTDVNREPIYVLDCSAGCGEARVL